MLYGDALNKELQNTLNRRNYRDVVRIPRHDGEVIVKNVGGMDVMYSSATGNTDKILGMNKYLAMGLGILATGGVVFGIYKLTTLK